MWNLQYSGFLIHKWRRKNKYSLLKKKKKFNAAQKGGFFENDIEIRHSNSHRRFREVSFTVETTSPLTYESNIAISTISLFKWRFFYQIFTSHSQEPNTYYLFTDLGCFYLLNFVLGVMLYFTYMLYLLLHMCFVLSDLYLCFFK